MINYSDKINRLASWILFVLGLTIGLMAVIFSFSGVFFVFRTNKFPVEGNIYCCICVIVMYGLYFSYRDIELGGQ